jgi:hypothetical protein
VVGAATGGHLNILQWVKEEGFFSKNFVPPKQYFSKSLEVLKFLKMGGLLQIDSFSVNEAMRHGDLEILIWLLQFYDKGPAFLKLDPSLFISEKHSEMVKYIYGNLFSKHEDKSRLVKAAATAGNLEMIKFFHNSGEGWPKDTCTLIAGSGNFESLKWVLDNGCPLDINSCSCITKGGNLEMLKWARDKKNIPWECHVHQHREEFQNVKMGT